MAPAPATSPAVSARTRAARDSSRQPARSGAWVGGRRLAAHLQHGLQVRTLAQLQHDVRVIAVLHEVFQAHHAIALLRAAAAVSLKAHSIHQRHRSTARPEYWCHAMRRALHLDSGEAGGLPRNLPQRLLPRGLPPLLGQNLHSHLLAGLPIHSPARPAPPAQRPRPQNHGLRRTKGSEAAHNRQHNAHGAGMPNPKDLGDAGQNHPSRTKGAATSPVHQAVGPAAQVGPLSQPRSPGQSGPECASQPFTQVPPSSNTGAARGVNTAGGRCSRARGRLHARPRQPLGARVRRAPAHNGRPPGPNPARSRTRRRWAGSAVRRPAGKRRAAAAGASGGCADLAAPSGGGPATKLAARLLAPTWRAAARCKPTRLHGGGQAGRCCNKTAVQGSWPRSVLAGLSKMAQQ